MDVYIDSLLLCAGVMNYLCLDIAAKIMNITIRKILLVVAASALAMLGIISMFGFKLRMVCLLFYIGVLRLLFGKSTFAGYIRRYGICIGVSMVFSAVMLTLIPPDRLNKVIFGSGMFFCADDLYFYGLLIPSYAMARLLIFFVSKNKRVFRVEMLMGGECTESFAFMDTGNSLREPDSGSPVIVAERFLFAEIPQIYKYIPYKTVGAGSSMLKVYPLDELYFPEEKKRIKNIFVAFSDKPLSDGKYRVLLNNSIFQK